MNQTKLREKLVQSSGKKSPEPPLGTPMHVTLALCQSTTKTTPWQFNSHYQSDTSSIWSFDLCRCSYDD